MQNRPIVAINQVQTFWETNPVSASGIPFPVGSPEYFHVYDALRESNESLEFSYRLHGYRDSAGKRVLDVGAGNGYVLSKYAHEGAFVYGIDLTEKAIDLCRKRFSLSGIRGHFSVGNAEQLPFEDGTFDYVCSMGVLHHTPDTARAVNEISRVLKPGGQIIVMFYHRDSLQYRFRFPIESLVTRKSMQQLVNEVDGPDNPKGDVYSHQELRELLQGFEHLETFVGLLRGWMIIPKLGRLIPNRLLKLFEKRWGWFLYGKGIKPQQPREKKGRVACAA